MKAIMKIWTTCPACGVNENFPHVAIMEGDGAEEFNLYRCYKCGLLFLHPVPEIQRYFHGELICKPCQQESSKIAMENYGRRVLRRYESHLFPGARILDFGCGFGHFLAVASEAGYYAEGVDISPGCREYIAKYLPNTTVYPELDNIPSDKRFDFITVFEVLYWIPFPRETLCKLQNLLRPGGSILVVVSVNRGWLIWLLSRIKRSPVKLRKNDWMTNALLNARAYYAFSTKSLVRLMESTGFTDLRISWLERPGIESRKLGDRIPRFIWCWCIRILWILSLGKVDLHTRVHVVGRYITEDKAQKTSPDSEASAP